VEKVGGEARGEGKHKREVRNPLNIRKENTDRTDGLNYEEVEEASLKIYKGTGEIELNLTRLHGPEEQPKKTSKIKEEGEIEESVMATG